jgi:hypothetical protein
MDEQLIWEKRNFKIRIILIILLLLIGGYVIKNKYGTPPSLADSKLLDALGNPIIDCRGALIYYAENKLNIINESEKNKLYAQFNISEFKSLT